jgi:putative SOS response-associated peptidase YedK
VKTTPAFRDAYKSRRCLVPADAFYEWKANGKSKQPYAIAMRDRQPFAFAGLWESWKEPKTQEWIRTFTILTTPPNEVVASLHDRMPLILTPHDTMIGWIQTATRPH